MLFLPQKNNALLRNPVLELEKLHREMSRLFDNSLYLKDENGAFLPGSWTPAVDIVDQKDKVIAKFDLPGLKKEDIDISIENNVLSVRGEKKEDLDQRDGDVIRAERYYGMFYRAFNLPTSVDPQRVTAKFENGVLEIQVLKREEAKPKQIKIDVK